MTNPKKRVEKIFFDYNKVQFAPDNMVLMGKLNELIDSVNSLLEEKEEKIKMYCPKCNKEYNDLDGFGVLYCPACGYCKHTSVTGGICLYCNQVIDEPKKEIKAEYSGPSGKIYRLYTDGTWKNL